MLKRVLILAVMILATCISTSWAGSKDVAYKKFNIGVTGIWGTIARSTSHATVVDIDSGSPADGILQPGDVITHVNGSKLEGIVGNYALGPDPRRILGEALGRAEASDGKLTFVVMRKGKESKLVVTIPVLGPYGEDWPRNCKKSERIVKQTAAYVKKSQKPDGSFYFHLPDHASEFVIGNAFAGLFLLSANDPDSIKHAERCAHYFADHIHLQTPEGCRYSQGYIGLFLAEYYLKTGDKTVLPALAHLCKVLAKVQIPGGWGHGGLPMPWYSHGGAVSMAGLPIFCALALARECGVAEAEKPFRRAYAFFSRFPGHDGSSYGDQRGDSGAGGCGKDALMATAFSLVSGKVSRQMSELMALQAAESYHVAQIGHGGCIFNVLWRGIGIIHLNKEQRTFYRRHMDELAWLYDLSRRYQGGFNMLPHQNSGYGSPSFTGVYWGIGLGLTYTAPRRTLRITGGKPTRYSVAVSTPTYSWNNGNDTVFLRTDYCRGGEVNTMTPAQIRKDVQYDLRGPRGSPSVQTCAILMRHYLPHVRNWAANNLNVIGTPAALDEIEKALQHTDTRVRRAGFNAICNYLGSWFTLDKRRNTISREVVARRFMPYIKKALDNPKCDWWELDGAIFALSRAGADNVRNYLPLLKTYAKHKEMWLRQSAFFCIIHGLDQEMDGDTLVFLAQCYANEGRPFLRNMMQEDFRYLTRTQKDGKRFRIPGGVRDRVVKYLAAPILNTHWGYGYVECGKTSRRDPYHVLAIIEQLDSKDFALFTDKLVGVIDSWEDLSFYRRKQIQFCETIARRAINMGTDGRILMERIAKVYDTKRKMRRGMKKVGEYIRAYETKFGKLKHASQKPFVAVKRDTRSLRKGLVGYWQFDEGIGTTSRDSSASDNNAMLKGASWDNGLIGKSVKMGKGQSVVIPGYKDPLTDGRIKNLTVSFWLKTKDYGSGRVGKGRHETFQKSGADWFYSFDARGAGWDVRAPDNALYAFATAAFDNGQHGLTAIANEEAGIDDYMFKVIDDGKTWHHVVMAYDGTRKAFVIWVDGVTCDTTSRWNIKSTKGLSESDHIIPAAKAVLTIGGTFSEDGKVESFDEVAIWDRVLTEREVNLLYNDGRGAVIDSP